MADIVAKGRQVDLPYGYRAPSTDTARSSLFPSLSEAGQFVHVGFSYIDVTNLGTFLTDSQVLAFQAIIIGYGPDAVSTRALPRDESEAWGRAVLRQEWESHLYRVHTDLNRDRLWFLFAALIDRTKGPSQHLQISTGTNSSCATRRETKSR